MKLRSKKATFFGLRLIVFNQKLTFFTGIFGIVFFISLLPSLGQTPGATPLPSPSPSPIAAAKTPNKSSLERNFFKNIVKDQGRIWSSPFRLQKRDMKWLIPLTAGTAGLIATDRKTAGALSNNRTRINVSRDFSDVGGLYGAGGTALAFYAVGKFTGNEKAKETGLLAGEALINSEIVVQVLKFATRRPRPLESNGHGTFFKGGNSFPSGHSASAWTVATIVADEYGKQHAFVKYIAYGLATGVSLSRFAARKHFLSDVVVGAAIGYGIGHFTYLRHHDPDLDLPGGKTTKLEKYFPAIAPQYDPRERAYGVALAWNF